MQLSSRRIVLLKDRYFPHGPLRATCWIVVWVATQ
jgi:hypothetical protein